MDLFYAGFSNNLPPLRFVRNLGLMAARRAGVLKRKALKYALGFVASQHCWMHANRRSDKTRQRRIRLCKIRRVNIVFGIEYTQKGKKLAEASFLM